MGSSIPYWTRCAASHLLAALGVLALIAVMLGFVRSGTAAEVNAETEAAARRVAGLIFASAPEQLGESVMGVMLDQVQKSNPGMPPEFDAFMREDFLREFNKIVPRLMDRMERFYGQVYAREFTLEELNTMADFFAGPVGQKYLQVSSEMSDEQMAFMAGQMDLLMSVMPAVLESMRKRGFDVPN